MRHQGGNYMMPKAKGVPILIRNSLFSGSPLNEGN